MALVATGADQRELDVSTEEMRRQIAFYASTPTYRPVLDTHDWGAVGETLGRLALRKQWDDMPQHVTDAMLDVFAVVATWDDLPDALRSRYTGRLDRLTLYRPFRTDEAHRWAQLCDALRGAPDADLRDAPGDA
jgi:hypothetical protein